MDAPMLFGPYFTSFSVGGGQSKDQTAVSKHLSILVLVYGAVSQEVKPWSPGMFILSWFADGGEVVVRRRVNQTKKTEVVVVVAVVAGRI